MVRRPDASVLAAMTDMIRHRGPDDRGTLCLSLRGGIPDTALGFHRLKILDLSVRGHQPNAGWCRGNALLEHRRPPREAALSRDDPVDRLDHLLGRSVQSQVRSNVNVGCQLSGGVDSSLVTVLARSHRRADLSALSIVFDEPQFSEEPWILAAAATARADSHCFVLDEAAFIDGLEAASWHMDQPMRHRLVRISRRSCTSPIRWPMRRACW
jgi:asparagine synthetase B (glutamine-hydrolysing)